MYSKNTLQNIRHALNRNLHDAGINVDITKDPTFVDSQKVYKDDCKELKAYRKAVVKSYPEIKHTGLLPYFFPRKFTTNVFIFFKNRNNCSNDNKIYREILHLCLNLLNSKRKHFVNYNNQNNFF